MDGLDSTLEPTGWFNRIIFVHDAVPAKLVAIVSMGKAQKRLIALSGPSCVGKGPLLAAAREFHGELPFDLVAVIKSRESRRGSPRPDEALLWDNPDYFRPSREIKRLRGDRYLHATSHGFPQALDLERIVAAEKDLVVVEASYRVTQQLKTAEYLAGIEVTTVFVSPIGLEEICYLAACDVHKVKFLRGLMARKLLARTVFHGEPYSEALLGDIARRAGDAAAELRTACQFDIVLISRDGEGAPSWNRAPSGRFLARPVGEAAETLEAFVELLAGRVPRAAEKWESKML